MIDILFAQCLDLIINVDLGRFHTRAFGVDTSLVFHHWLVDMIAVFPNSDAQVVWGSGLVV